MSEGLKSVFQSAAKTFINAVLIATVALGALSIGYKSLRPAPATGGDLAIALAKQSMQTGVEDFAGMLKRYMNVAESDRLDSLVQSRLGELRGALTVKGWSAKEVDGGLHLVSFEWSNPSGGGDMGVYFEVDTKNRFARPIVPDDELALKYGILSQEAFDKEEALTRELIKRNFPEGAVEYANHILTVRGKSEGDYNPEEVAKSIHRNVKEAFGHRKDKFLRVKMTKGTTVAEYAAAY